ncbi:Ubiquitin-conjugating enzyme E2 [Spironucleus salmonicida]|uniref:Ubiquitin-conjugating enzyme E2 n=1 Tax=Spironucleus salmonicida TaxID=348837 RepID=V6LSH1_9EUKA|nr:Ubiquitin-conjugating enzyme E2 [Spironucleus salmonicida]|eukprot:EST43709.1 Ubiquitin-conjugating enzyme E2 [Spironucleus salmonicida]
MNHLIKLAKTRPVSFLSDTQVLTYFQSPNIYPFNSAPLKVYITIPPNFPEKSPSVGLEPRRIWHPNVDFYSGSVCADVIGEKWHAESLVYVLEYALPQLLSEPNFVDPLNFEVKQNDWKEKAYSLIKDIVISNEIWNVDIAFWSKFDKFLQAENVKQKETGDFIFIDDCDLDLD